MLTKTSIAQKVADEGITVIIANGKRDNILTDLLCEGCDMVSTRFEPSPKGVSSVKKWVAHSEGFAKGEVYINAGAKKALLGDKATSILFVGVIDIKGDFEKGDIAKILDEENRPIGIGKVQYSSDKARQLIGKKGHRPLMHYDYLYLD
jgi:glutamate 5-kinase